MSKSARIFLKIVNVLVVVLLLLFVLSIITINVSDVDNYKMNRII